MQPEQSETNIGNNIKSRWSYFSRVLRNKLPWLLGNGNAESERNNLDLASVDNCNGEVEINNVHMAFASNCNGEVERNNLDLAAETLESGSAPNLKDQLDYAPSANSENSVYARRSTESTNFINANDKIVHQNLLNKDSSLGNHIRKLVLLERRKFFLLEQKKAKTENLCKSNDDIEFFNSLLPHVKEIDGINKLLFRIEVEDLVLKYAYSPENIQYLSASSSTPFQINSKLNSPFPNNCPSKPSTTLPETSSETYNASDIGLL